MAEASEDKQAAKKVEDSLIAMTKGESNTNLNMELVMRPYANWEHFLSPAPMSIALLGQLMIIASETDFSLAKNPPTEGFQHMKHPSSFRASLLQVSNAVYEAFDQANSSMDQIRIRTLTLPSEVKNALKIIIAGENNEIKRIVPSKLARIKEAADKCLQFAKETESKFEGVMLLTAEILEACTKTQGENDQEVATTLTTIKHLKERVEKYKQEQQNDQKDLQELKADVQNAHKQIEAAMDGLPSAWETLGMSVISTVTTGLTHKFSGMLGCVATVTTQLGPQIMETAKAIANSGQFPTLTPDQAQPKTTARQKADINVCMKHSQILIYANILSSFIIEMESDSEQETKLKLSENIHNIDKGSKYVELQFKTLIEEVQREIDADEGVRGIAIEICKTGEKIAQDLTKLNCDMDQHQNEIKEIDRQVKQMKREAQLFQTLAMKKLQALPIPSTTPQHAGAQEKCGLAAGQNVLIASIEAARFKTEQAMSLLKNAEERHEKMAKDMKEKNEAAMNLMQEMSKQDVRRLDLETIRSVLFRGMKALASIRDQWAKLVEFFKMMSHIMECALTVSLEEFTNTVDGSCGDKKVGTLTLSHAVRDVLFEEAYMAIKISHLVNMLSTTYCEVSKDHIMGRIGVLYHIVAMDPKYQLEDMKYHQRQLLDGCQEAQRKIQELACSNAEEFHATIQERINRIEHEVSALLPPPATPEEAAAIEQKRAEIKDVIARADQEEDKNLAEWL
ncbi:uncharacterized protein LOC106167278 [Lingula anatina]|uniref:Uncharacterized protein LOC106167278 n=1 Tax=Lingula anatina TaxID=7574 RepID=A0A1S3IV95_LINAN|nr:uncharacterized protein LOC106167278 [Lingula anatina]|eukprot:XP_013401464.1 uncharacterized protein LOC106167278 [Lingula anatina]